MWKVLIADDEPKIRQGLKSVLEEMKLPITVCAEARNGMEALEKIEQFQPDFILMDICMPKLSGIQFLEELRKLDKNCPVIVISGFNEFSYAKQAIKLGVSEYLLKPIAEEELQAAVVKVTEEIKQKRKSEKFMELVKQQMIQNQDYLRDVFFNEWMEGKLSRFEWEEQARFLDMDFPDNMILILVSVQSSYDKKIDKGTVTEEIYKITLEKIIRELMEPYHTVSVFSSKYEDVAIVMEKLPENFQEFSADLQLQKEEKVDKSYALEVKGVANLYKEGDVFTCTLKVHGTDSYLKFFWFDSTGGALLYPNTYEPNTLLQAEKEYSIPFSNAVDYRMEKQGKESEKINMMMVATKENIPFTDEVTYQNVLKWVYSIPNDKRCAFYDMILIK